MDQRRRSSAGGAASQSVRGSKGCGSGHVRVTLIRLQPPAAPADKRSMRRVLVFATAVAAALMLCAPVAAARSSMRLPAAPASPPSRSRFRRTASIRRRSTASRGRSRGRPDEPAARKGIPATGRVGRATRSALGPLGRPLLGQRELAVGAVGWDVSSLEFRLVPYGLDPRRSTAGSPRRPPTALARFQAKKRLAADGIAGKLTFRALAGGDVAAGCVHAARCWRRTSSRPARASTRSRSATASARCCSRSRAVSSSPR